MKRGRYLLFLLLQPMLMQAQSKYSLCSPSENLQAEIQVETSGVQIDLFANGEKVVRTKTLQFSTEKKIIEGNWQVVGQKSGTINQTWKPVYGERSLIRDKYNELNLSIESDVNQKEMELKVRLYNEGLAFQYAFDETDFWNNVLVDEKTQFVFDKDYTTWVTGNAQGAYSKKSMSTMEGAVDRPQVIQLDNSRYIAIGEAALVDYARMKLRKIDAGYGVQSELSGKVNLDLANYHSPWRYVMVAGTPGTLVENNDFVLNLNEPNRIEDTSWIKPGKVIREVTLTTQGGLACVDFAARNKIEYVEFDAGWYGPENNKASDASVVSLDTARSKGPFDLFEIIKYANKKNVGVILYVNRFALAKQLDQILPLYKKWGIKGVKFGFVDVGDQYSTSWLHNAVRKAAKYKLMVDIHDEYRPTGYSRTYPNLITQEGIRGDEESPALAQTIYTLYNRMICGAGDYTNCFFAGRVSEKMGGKAAQMAKAIAIYSPWQFIYWYDRPEMSPHKTAGAGSVESIITEDKATEFYRHLPTDWDDTRFLDGAMGEYATVARKSGNNWYIGTLNANEKRNITLKLDFLDNGADYQAILYYQTPADKKKNRISIKHIDLKQKRSLPLELESNSGCAIYLSKVSNF